MSRELIADLLDLLFGAGDLNAAIWGLVTLGVVGLGALAVAATGSFVDVAATQLLLRPGRVALWLFVAPVATALVFSTAVVTVVGIPLAIIIAMAALIITLYGYMAVGRAVASRLAGDWNSQLAGLGWTLLAVVFLRATRLIPEIGGMIHGAVVWLAFSIGMLAAWELFRSWQDRRLPDDEQFPGQVIEWEDPR